MSSWTDNYNILDQNDRWSLFRGSFSTKFAWADYRVVVVARWSLAQV